MAASTIIVGAGMAGLTAAGVLRAAGREVIVLDKGRSPGGRMPTRRLGGSRIDHGAQFFTVRTPEFAAQVAEWTASQVVDVWSHGFGSTEDSTPDASPDRYPRYIGIGGMTGIAKAMAEGLDLRCNQMVFSIRRRASDSQDPIWEVTLDDGSLLVADQVLLTCPLPQTASLLMESGLPLPDDLWRIGYHRTIGLLISLDGPSGLRAPGALTGNDLAGTELNFVADQQLKGISAEPAVLVHASHEWSLRWWETDPDKTATALLDIARVHLGGARVLESQLKKWRLATPMKLWPGAFWGDETGSLAIAGDAFASSEPSAPQVPNLEGAHLSGRAAAHHLLGMTDHRH